MECRQRCPEMLHTTLWFGVKFTPKLNKLAVIKYIYFRSRKFTKRLDGIYIKEPSLTPINNYVIKKSYHSADEPTQLQQSCLNTGPVVQLQIGVGGYKSTVWEGRGQRLTGTTTPQCPPRGEGTCWRPRLSASFLWWSFQNTLDNFLQFPTT